MNLSRDIDTFSSCLANGARKIGLVLDHHCLEAMTCHAAELIKWNQKINLTAIKDPLAIAEKHFIDALAAGQFIGQETAFIDLGPGGGFPSMPMKIQNPDLNFCLVEAVQKKTNFLSHVIRQLKLTGIEAVHTRIEDFAQTGQPRPQAVITRGVAHMETLISLVSPLIFPEGTLYAMKGEKVQEEISPDLKKKYDIHLDKYFLPFSNSLRYLVRIRSITS